MSRRVSGVLTLLALLLALGASVATSQDQSIANTTDKVSKKREERALKWKERILRVPVGSYVKGTLENQQEFEGQLREISDSNFAIQSLKGHSIGPSQ